MKQKLRSGLAALCVLLLCACTALADGPALRAEAGYAGTMLGGKWLPVDVELRAGSEAVDGVLSVEVYKDIGLYDRLEMPVTAAAGETLQVHFSVLPRLAQHAFTVRMTENGVETAQTQAVCTRWMPDDTMAIGVLGGDEALVHALNTIRRVDAYGREESLYAAALDSGSFPATAQELGAFSALTGEGIGGLTQVQQAMIAAWEEDGGVIVSCPQELPASDAEPAAGVGRDEEAHGDDPEVRAAALLDNIAGLLQGASYRRTSFNYTYGSGVNGGQRVSRAQSILPAAALLAAYALFAGGGLYWLAKRSGRSKTLWLAIPATAMLCTLATVLLGGGTDLNAPAAAQLHVTTIDEQGRAKVEESARVSYAGQARVLMTAEGGAPIERQEYAYYSSFTDTESAGTLRDRIILGDAPGLELSGGATWLTRDLMVRSNVLPQGTVEAAACMEEDGLHATIVNRTDVDLANAWLLTEIGYSFLGDIPAGETAEALLRRTESVQRSENGEMLVFPDEALPCPSGLYRVIDCAVFPEQMTGGGKMTDERQYSGSLLDSKLSLAGQSGQAGFQCVLVADTPQLVCAQLYADGQPIARSASESMLIRSIPLDRISPNGHLYVPQRTLEAHQVVTGKDGGLSLGDPLVDGYLDTARDSLCFGYRLEEAETCAVTEIRVAADASQSVQDQLSIELYDHQLGEWIAADGGLLARVSGDQAARCVNERGEIFVRYAIAGEAEGSVYRPGITVEGGEAR